MSTVDSFSRFGDRDYDRLLQELLVKTSRTFALAIPMLPEPTVKEVTVAYLLFRIADTFEDASLRWDKPQQLAALAQFVQLMEEPSVEDADHLAARWLERPPSHNPGYLQLLENTPAVIAGHLELSAAAQRVVAHHTIRTSIGMASVVERTGSDGILRLASVADVRDYCYIVAGIVGEMLTDLFLLGRQHLEAIAGYLRERDARFGEGLQLVNILKDSADDVVEGRDYLPDGIERDDFFALAREDLQAATEYTLAIQQAGGPDGIVLFTALPVELAWATLKVVEQRGPGAKLTRPQVLTIYQRLQRTVRHGRPAVSPPEFNDP